MKNKIKKKRMKLKQLYKKFNKNTKCSSCSFKIKVGGHMCEDHEQQNGGHMVEDHEQQNGGHMCEDHEQQVGGHMVEVHEQQVGGFKCKLHEKSGCNKCIKVGGRGTIYLQNRDLCYVGSRIKLQNPNIVTIAGKKIKYNYKSNIRSCSKHDLLISQ